MKLALGHIQHAKKPSAFQHAFAEIQRPHVHQLSAVEPRQQRQMLPTLSQAVQGPLASILCESRDSFSCSGLVAPVASVFVVVGAKLCLPFLP